jgi:hypothetical protein
LQPEQGRDELEAVLDAVLGFARDGLLRRQRVLQGGFRAALRRNVAELQEQAGAGAAVPQRRRLDVPHARLAFVQRQAQGLRAAGPRRSGGAQAVQGRATWPAARTWGKASAAGRPRNPSGERPAAAQSTGLA